MREETTTSSSPAREELSFDGSFGCACGKIRVDVVQPKSSTFVTPTAAMCQCNDCFEFAASVSKFRQEHCPESPEKADALTESNATDMRQIYKSDAVQMAGQDHLQGIKLKEDSPCVRYYSTCCGTPLMMDYTMAPFFLVFQHTIATDDDTASFQRMQPTVVLNHQSAPEGTAPTPEGIPVRDGVPLGFISHAVARAVFGMVSGKKTSPIAPQVEMIPVAVGIESIGKKATEEEG